MKSKTSKLDARSFSKRSRYDRKSIELEIQEDCKRILFSFLTLVAASVVTIFFIGRSQVTAQTREPLLDLKLPNTTIESVETIAAGAFKPPPGTAALPFKTLPAFRRVAGVIKPTSESIIRFEVWLPVENWNDKFFGVGNGGFAGSISYADMALLLSRGYAAASTDTGHTGTAFDASWAVGQPQKIIDFGHRAIHEMTVKAKAIVKANYGKASKFSYFIGCSNGGRQALMEAQRYPEDYDGIIAGAPANYWTRLMTQGASVAQVMLSDAANYIPRKKMKTLETAVLASCDSVDGLKDNLLDDPRRCRFDPTVLLCNGTETDVCFTAPQIEVLKKIYAGLQDSIGNQIAPGIVPGGEAGPSGWEQWVSGYAPGKSPMNTITEQFFKNMVFENQNWDFKSFNVERDLKIADQKFAAILNATNPDLKAFKKRGGKLIIYHGWNDAAIPAEMSINYYNSVTGKMGQGDSGAFIRLYMVPGMHHCTEGPGPNKFGQTSNCLSCDAKQDIKMALEQWVEKGVAPSSIIATKYKDEFRQTGIVRTRPLCPYPHVARYKGSGNIDEAANFACVNPK